MTTITPVSVTAVPSRFKHLWDEGEQYPSTDHHVGYVLFRSTDDEASMIFYFPTERVDRQFVASNQNGQRTVHATFAGAHRAARQLYA